MNYVKKFEDHYGFHPDDNMYDCSVKFFEEKGMPSPEQLCSIGSIDLIISNIKDALKGHAHDYAHARRAPANLKKL